MFPESTYDACSQAPCHRVALDQVSICHQRIHLQCHDGELGDISGLFTVRAGVTLKATQRGIHMSRIEGAFRDVPHGLTLAGAATHLARAIRALQGEAAAAVSLVGSVPFNRRTRATSQLSPGTLRLHSRAKAGEVESSGFGLRLGVMTCCPCMQPYSLEETARFAEIAITDPSEVISKIPVATHSQKGSVAVFVRGTPATIDALTFGRLYEAVASAVHPTWELLKRADEYDLIRRAHLRPQFVEDVVRDVLVAVGRTCNALYDGGDENLRISVTASSMESIHGHDIGARKTVNLDSLRRELAALSRG